MTTPTLATIWTKPGTALLEESCRRWGLPLMVLQRGSSWTSYRFNKVDLLLRDLERTEFEVVLFCDACDVFFSRATVLEESLAVLDRSGSDIVVSGESNCFPWPKRHRAWYQGTARCRFPNAGVWIGRRDAVLGELKLMTESTDDYSEDGWDRHNCESQFWHEMILAGRAKVEDTERWCLNIYGLSDAEVAESVRDNRPLIVHGSSPENKGRVNDLWRKVR